MKSHTPTGVNNLGQVNPITDGQKKNVRFKFERNKPTAWGDGFVIPIPLADDVVGKTNAAATKIQPQVAAMFEEASKFRQNMDAYIMDGELQYGLDCVINYNNLKAKVNAGFAAMEKETGVKPQIPENKTKAEKLLDKLIKEVILNR